MGFGKNRLLTWPTILKKNFETSLGGPGDYLATTGGALVLAFGQQTAIFIIHYITHHYLVLGEKRGIAWHHIFLKRGESQANPQRCLAK